MTFDELLTQLKTFNFEETRSRESNYFEAVIAVKDLSLLALILQSYFGEPLKPAGKSPSREAKQFSEPYGGIQGNQTLYLSKADSGHSLAMLWPWGNGESVTLKVIHEIK